MTTIKDIERTIESMSREFRIEFRFDRGSEGTTWKLNLDECGRDFVTSRDRSQFLRDVQNFREGLRFMDDMKKREQRS